MVPGHEIIGKVVSVGKDVKSFKPGDSVGVGCMVDSCRKCSACEQGLEQYCEHGATFTYNDTDRHDKMPTYGGYSRRSSSPTSSSSRSRMASTSKVRRLFCAPG